MTHFFSLGKLNCLENKHFMMSFLPLLGSVPLTQSEGRLVPSQNLLFPDITDNISHIWNNDDCTGGYLKAPADVAGCGKHPPETTVAPKLSCKGVQSLSFLEQGSANNPYVTVGNVVTDDGQDIGCFKPCLVPNLTKSAVSSHEFGTAILPRGFLAASNASFLRSYSFCLS